jgi:hypothetical protein
LNVKAVGAMADDRDGNPWMAALGSGSMKMACNGFTTYTAADGTPFAQSFAMSRKVEMCALFREKDGAYAGWFGGSRFVDVKPAWPREFN